MAEVSVTSSRDNSLNVNIYTGIDNEDKLAPCVICHAESATEDFPNSGIYHVKTSVTVKEIAADTSVTSSLGYHIFKSYLSGSTKGILNNYPHYYVYDWFVEGVEESTSQDAWVQTYAFDVVCGASEI